jgi:hypothetical protein
MEHKGIVIINDTNFLITEGLAEKIGFEFRLKRTNDDLSDGINILIYLIDYSVDHKPEIKIGETIQYGFWVLKFLTRDNHYLDIWECTLSLHDWIEGASTAIEVFKEHKDLMSKLNVEALVPTFNQKIVISEGVLEGDFVEGVRYPSPGHMSGWWLSTDRYNGDLGTMKPIPLHEFIPFRPDLIKYLILPFGFRFDTRSKDVWFDESATKEG